MSTKFGWCISGHHNACPVQVSSATGGLVCGCICHDKAACESGESPVDTGVLGLAHERMVGKTKGRIALTNPTLLATISSDRKGREGNHA